jgi:hypothetical protein
MMGKQLNWDRPGLRRDRNGRESKYAGRTLDNGAFIPGPRLDGLALRAAREMRQWSKRLAVHERESLDNPSRGRR